MYLESVYTVNQDFNYFTGQAFQIGVLFRLRTAVMACGYAGANTILLPLLKHDYFQHKNFKMITCVILKQCIYYTVIMINFQT